MSLQHSIRRIARRYLSAGRYFVRFGDIPKSGRSSINPSIVRMERMFDPNYEPNEGGVSVFETQRKGAKWELVINTDRLQMSAQQLIDELCSPSTRREIFLLTGEELPHGGTDGEPLLVANTIKIVRKLKFEDLDLSQLDMDIDYPGCLEPDPEPEPISPAERARIDRAIRLNRAMFFDVIRGPHRGKRIVVLDNGRRGNRWEGKTVPDMADVVVDPDDVEPFEPR